MPSAVEVGPSHTTTKFPELSLPIDAPSWSYVVVVFTKNSLPAGAPVDENLWPKTP